MKPVVSKADRLYVKLLDEVAQRRAGEHFMTIREIMRCYDVSQSVVDRAVSQLRTEGRITVTPGRRGLFVTAPGDGNERGCMIREVLLMMPRWRSCEIDELTGRAEEINAKGGDLRIRCEFFDYSGAIPCGIEPELWHAAGMMIMPSSEKFSREDVMRLLRYCEIVPTLVWGHYFDCFGVAGIGLDDHAAAARAVSHLSENGHRHIGVLLSEPHNKVIMDRVRGALTYAELHGIRAEVIDCEISPGEVATPKTYDRFCRVVREGFDFTGLVGVSGESMQGAVNACRNHGISIPEQLGVVAIAGEGITRTGCPPLDTVPCDVGGQLECAFGMIGEMIREHTHFPGYGEYWRSPLLKRGSVLKIKR